MKSLVVKQLGRLSPLQIFLVKAVLLFVVWEVAYYLYIGPHTSLDGWLVRQVTGWGVSILDLFHGNASQDKNTVILDGIRAVWVGVACNGLEVQALFIGFIIAAQGKFLPKIIYMLIGVIIVFFSNALRVAVLALNYVKSPETFDFNHKYTYAIVVYAVVFALWMVWVEYYSKPKTA